MKFLSQYDYTIHYIPGKDNSVTNTLSQWPGEDTECCVTPVMLIENDKNVLDSIRKDYAANSYTKQILDDMDTGLTPHRIEKRIN